MTNNLLHLIEEYLMIRDRYNLVVMWGNAVYPSQISSWRNDTFKIEVSYLRQRLVDAGGVLADFLEESGYVEGKNLEDQILVCLRNGSECVMEYKLNQINEEFIRKSTC